MNWSETSDLSAAKLGALLVKTGLVNPTDMQAVLRDTQGLNADLPFILHIRGLVDEITVGQTISREFKLPFLDTFPASTILTDLNTVSIGDMESYRIVPIACDHSGSIPRIKVVTSNPFNLLHCQHLSSQVTLEIVVGVSSVIRDALNDIAIKPSTHTLDAQILSQLMTSGIVTSAQVDFAKGIVLKQRRNPLADSGSNSTTSSELTKVHHD